MSLGTEIAKAVTAALRETFGESFKVSRRKDVVILTSVRQHRRTKPVAEPKRRAKSVQPAVRPFKRGEYDALVVAACVGWRRVAEMMYYDGLRDVVASRLATKCLAMFRAGKLERRKCDSVRVEYEYRRIEVVT